MAFTWLDEPGAKVTPSPSPSPGPDPTPTDSGGFSWIDHLTTPTPAPDPTPTAVADDSGLVADVNRGLTAADEGRDLLYYKTGKTKSEREALNAPLREAMQVPAVSPEAIGQVLQALNTTDEQGPAQQGIDEKVSQALSSMTTGEGVTSAPLYMFPPTAVGMSAENIEQIPSEVGQAAQQFAQGDIQQGAGTTTEALLNALTASGVLHARVPFVPETPIPPIGTPLVGKPLVGPPGTTASDFAAQAQPPPVQLPVSQEGVPPLVQPGDESYAGVTPQAGEVPPPEIGVAERYREEQQPGSVTPGTVQDAAHWRGKGREYINAGGDPRMPIRAAQAGHVSPRNVGIVSAQYELLAEQTQAAAQAVQDNPGNPQAIAALDSASRAQASWSAEMQPVFTRASESLSAIQGKLPVDETTFAGMYDKALELNGGQPLPKPQQAELVRRSAKAAKARSAEKQTYAKMDRAVPGRAPTDAEMQARVQDMVKRLTPC